MDIDWVDINWGAFVGITIAICICIGPFAYKDRRTKGGTHFRAALDVLLVFAIVLLWVAGGSITVYGLGIVFDRPAQTLGSGGFSPAETHMETVRGAYVLLGLGLMAAGYAIGKVCELRK